VAVTVTDDDTTALMKPSDKDQSPPCLTTHGGDCLTNAEFTTKVQELTTEVKTGIVSRVRKDLGRDDHKPVTWPLDMVNTYKALANLELVRGADEASTPGKGITLGIIDTGISSSHHAFQYNTTARTITQEYLAGAKQEAFGEFSHGTAVASIAAGRYYGAYGADVKMFAIPLGSPDGKYTPITVESLSQSDNYASQLYTTVLGKSIDILNLSFGYNGGIEGYTEKQLRDNYSKTIKALAQADRTEKTILVWAAGNAWGEMGAQASSPEILAGLVARISELQGHSVAVVSVGSNGKISSFSNRCGIAKNFCLAAPGQSIFVANTRCTADPNTTTTCTQAELDSQYGVGSGTSYAAPMVSGGLAIMKQLFRNQLSNEELVSRLFATANDDGIYATANTYGHGLMDLGAATNPWGIPAFMGAGQSTSAVETQGSPITAAALAAGPALGDAFSHALGSQEVAAFDSLGGPFWFNADAFVVESPGASLAILLQDFLRSSHRQQPAPETWQFHVQKTAPPTADGHLALANGASSFTMTGPQGVTASFLQAPERLHSLTLSWEPPSLPMVSFAAGHVKEYDSLLGSQGSGAFGQLSAETVFLGAGVEGSAGRWSLSAMGEVGIVTPSVASSHLITTISSLGTSAFRLQARRSLGNGGALSLSLSQPLRVDRGAAVFSPTTGRTKDGVVIGASSKEPLSPSGRQLDLGATLELPLARGNLSLRVAGSIEPQHQSTAETQWAVFTGYRATW
ncbi:MAG TPA: hypothetical protein DD643_01890, partial [Synechococcus sp. UBA8638]|nr:hypothetical protein [Synechococcus sp. UBA8638]